MIFQLILRQQYLCQFSMCLKTMTIVRALQITINILWIKLYNQIKSSLLTYQYQLMLAIQILSTQKDNSAYASILSAQIIFPLAQIYAVQHNFSIYQINYMRGLLVIILSAFIARSKEIQIHKTILKNFKILLIRNIFYVIWLGATTISFYYISFAQIYSINIFGSICVFIWDSHLYDIHINKHQKIGVFFGIFGSLLLINSKLIMSVIDDDFESYSNFDNFRSDQILDMMICSIVLFLSNITFGLSLSMTKSIKIQKDPCEINFHLGILLVFLSAIGWMFKPQKHYPPSNQYLWSALLTTVPQTIGTQLHTMAFTLTKKTGIVSLFLTVSVIVSYLIGIIRFQQSFQFVSLFGSFAIIIGISITILSKNKQN